MLELLDVTYSFARQAGGVRALDGVSLRVPPGEVVGLVGPNGAGKTTLIRVIFGIVRPDRGGVRWEQRDAVERDRAAWGYMPQERGLYRDMKLHDQVVFFGRLHGMARDDASAQADRLLRRLGLTDRRDDRVDKLSGGMQQRAQLAVALVHDPDVLVLDEPFSGLDPVAVDALSGVIRARADAGRTVLFSSHQLDLVEDLCDTVVMLDHGRVVRSGSLADLRSASPRRRLRVALADAPAGWTTELTGVRVVEDDASGVRLELEPGVDPLAVLDRVRTFGWVTDFGLDQPTLTELFLEAVGRTSYDTDDVDGPAPGAIAGGDRS